jgi:hypothetical protein
MSARQNAHLTYRGNLDVGRHGWLRLTPAYSVRLVRQQVADLPPSAVVTDPFSGTGTTALAAAEHGCRGRGIDVNPFLIWLGRAKTAHYPADLVVQARADAAAVMKLAGDRAGDPGLWQPPLHRIERWWDPGALEALKSIRSAIDDQVRDDRSKDLLLVGFCRTLIAVSNAAFDHQSMSFKAADRAHRSGLRHRVEPVLTRYAAETETVIAGAETALPGRAYIEVGDSRTMDAEPAGTDLLFTSPPYVNRMSYIRELRPYMYWLRFLDDAAGAAQLDWEAIGGTWGTATSRLLTWRPSGPLPIDVSLRRVTGAIERDGGKSGPVLAHYVHKYFEDMWSHVRAAHGSVRSGGRATYIIGNSTFYGHVVPAQDWLAILLRQAGFASVSVRSIRKRSSKKALYEYDVTANRA